MTGGQMHRFDRLDHYEAALAELLAKKQKGQPIAAAKKAAPSNVVNLIDALRASLKFGKRSRRPDPKKPRRRKPPRSARQDDAPAYQT